jgi:hypothetical protein
MEAPEALEAAPVTALPAEYLYVERAHVWFNVSA